MPWILLFLPFAVAVANQLFVRKTGMAPLLSVASSIATFVMAVMLLGTQGTMSFPTATIGNFSINIGIKLDRL